MKKVLAALLSFCMLFCLTACGPNNTTGADTSNDDVSQADKQETTNKNEFIAGEILTNLIDLPLSFPYGKDGKFKINVQEINITKSEILNPNELDDYDYNLLRGYTFYRYKYTIAIKGNTDTQCAGDYINFAMHFPHGSLNTYTYFDGNILKEGILSGSYDSVTNKTKVNGCVFKIQNDGSFTGDFVGYSNDNLDEYMITRIFYGGK